MVEMLLRMEPLEGVVLTVLEGVRREKIEDAIACYAESSARTTGLTWNQEQGALREMAGESADPSMTDALNCRKQPNLLIDMAYTPKAD